MSRHLPDLLLPHSLEYILLDPKLIILDHSPHIDKFLEHHQPLQTGEDARIFFPELVGMEGIIENILQQQQEQFEIQGITRHQETDHPIYFNLLLEKIKKYLIIFFTDVTQIMQLEQSLVQRANEAELLLSALTASEDYNRKILTSMGDALIITNPSGKIKTINPAAQKLFHYSYDQVMGHSIDKIIKDKVFLKQVTQSNNLEQFTDIKDIEIVCQTQQGTQLIVEFSCSIIQTTDTKQPALVYIGRDITARKKAEEEMNKALQKEKELNELKSRFISMTSHEFRNPLSSILMSVELLENFSSQWPLERRAKHLQRIKQCTANMTNLLEDILVIGRAEAGKLKLSVTQFNLREFCEFLVEDIQFIAGKNYKIILNIKPNIQWVEMDEKLLRHILVNLLSNAIKYSPEGGEVKLLIQSDPNSDKHRIKFIVEDQGIGIPSEDQEHLFESFHRAKNVGDIEGTGLGLSIVKRAVDLHQGTIYCSSKMGQGTRFEVDLPINIGFTE